MTIDLVKLRELAAELGYWPATTDPDDIDRHRRANKALDAAPPPERVRQKYKHLHQEYLRNHPELLKDPEYLRNHPEIAQEGSI